MGERGVAMLVIDVGVKFHTVSVKCANIFYIYNFDSEVFSTYIGWRVLDDFVGSY
jgi:hypothetical protein